jgi:hypothetical protein
LGVPTARDKEDEEAAAPGVASELEDSLGCEEDKERSSNEAVVVVVDVIVEPPVLCESLVDVCRMSPKGEPGPAAVAGSGSSWIQDG